MVELKIRVFGVCLGTKIIPETEQPVVYILTPRLPYSRRAHNGAAQINALYTALIVKTNNILPGSPRKPDHTLPPGENKFGVFMLDREEVTILNNAPSGVYVQGGEAGYPGTAKKNHSFDSRWICDLAELLPGSKLIPNALQGTPVPPQLSVRLALKDGQVTGEFKCADPPPKIAFLNSGVRRIIAEEIVLTYYIPDAVRNVSLKCVPFDSGRPDTRIDLISMGVDPIEVFFVNSPLVTFEDVANNKRCTQHINDVVDYEFEVLWDLVKRPDSAGETLPVPRLPRDEGSEANCYPAHLEG